MDERVLLRYAVTLGLVGIAGLVLVWIFASPQLTTQDPIEQDSLVTFSAHVDTATSTQNGVVFSVSRVCEKFLYIENFTDPLFLWENSFVEVTGRQSGDFFDVENIRQI
ncbi:MAG: hypothetical protein ACOCQQ_02745 [Candidatus Nanoarchaeia archaeon]